MATAIDLTPVKKTGHTRVPELDGVRGLAVWMVVLAHLIAPDTRVMEIVSGLLPRPLVLIVSHGWMGVDLFFVLSGFLITGILLDGKSSPGYLRNFYIRRIFRIFPLYIATILLFWFCYGYAAYFVLSLLFLANMAQLWNVPEPHGPGVYWSLAVEEHFYLFWPLLVRALNRFWLAFVCLAICIAEPFIRMATSAAGLDFYTLTWCRLDGLAIGALLAIWFRLDQATRRNSLLVTGCLLGAALIITAIGVPFGIAASRGTVATGFRSTQANLVFGALVCVACGLQSSKWTRLLRLRFLGLSGEISYCLYLVHLSLADGYDNLLTRVPALHALTPQAGVFFRAVCVASVAWLIAVLSRRYFEGPILRQKERFIVRY